LFTSTNPELRRVIPEVNGRVKVKVVYTVLEAQYQSALTAAVQAINASNKTVCFELVGYLLEELRDNVNYESFKADLADANIFIGSLIFIEELAEKVRACSSGEENKTQHAPSASTAPMLHQEICSGGFCRGFVGNSRTSLVATLCPYG
jgi:magnesium chelatase subunit H